MHQRSLPRPLRLLAVTLMSAVLLPVVVSAQTHDFVNGQAATAVVGQPDFATFAPDTTASSLMSPHGVTVDRVNRKLYVADTENNRILRYDLDEASAGSPAAEAVFGHSDFTTPVSSGSPTDSTLFFPWDTAVDPETGDLYVADTFRGRVLRFDAAHTAPSGAAASLVLGKASFTDDSLAGASRTAMTAVFAVEIGLRGELWVADGTRVLRFNNPRSLTNGAPADAVLGQADFTTNDAGTLSQAGFAGGVQGLAISPDGALYAVEMGASRILRWKNAFAAANGAPADAVLGQSDFTSDLPGVSATKLNTPDGIAVDANGRLYVADLGNGRVVWYNNADTLSNGAAADGVLGHVDLTGTTADGDDRMLGFPRGVALGADHELWVVDRLLSRVLLFTYVPPEVPDAERAQCGQLPDLAVSPERIELAPGGTAQIEVALRNLCSDRSYSNADLLLSLNEQLQVTGVPSGWVNLGNRAAWQNLYLKPDETVKAVLTVSAPNGVPAGPSHIWELYAQGRVQKRIDGVFLTSAPAPAAVAALVVEAPAVPVVEAPLLPAVLPNTGGPLLPLGALALSGLALAAAGMIARRRG